MELRAIEPQRPLIIHAERSDEQSFLRLGYGIELYAKREISGLRE